MIFKAKTKFPISSWAGRLFGEPAFIIGNGPSLLENNIKLINNYFTIGTNRAFKVLLPKILIWQDESLYEDCYNEIRKLACVKITKESLDFENIFTHFTLEPGNFVFGKNPSILYGGGSTVVLAIQLAVSLGCSSLILLGCDCNYRGNKTDFYGENKNHSIGTLSNFLAAMEWVHRECPIPVFNCGDAPYWPRTTLELAVEKTQPKERNHLQWLNKLL